MNIIFLLLPLSCICFEACQQSRSLNPPDCLNLNYPQVEEVTTGLKIAFMADQTLHTTAYEVINMLNDQGVDAIFHPGDLDYTNNPTAWGSFIDDTLGEGFPYFASYGNHEAKEWEGTEGYQGVIYNRLYRNNETCIGTVGLAMICSFRGVSLALLGPASTTLNGGFTGNDLVSFVNESFTQFGTRWRFCLFHHNQNDYQLGNKPNDVGYALFEACREMGAIIINGHSHTYARTHLMGNFEEHTIVDSDNNLTISEGSVFLAVSGVAGQTPSDCNTNRGGYQNFPWWGKALCATTDPALKQGALIFTFDASTTATVQFIEYTNEVQDQFTLVSNLSLSSLCQPTQGATCQSLVSNGSPQMCDITVDTGCEIISCGCSIGENCIDNLCECNENECKDAGRICSEIGCVFKSESIDRPNTKVVIGSVFGSVGGFFIIGIVSYWIYTNSTKKKPIMSKRLKRVLLFNKI